MKHLFYFLFERECMKHFNWKKKDQIRFMCLFNYLARLNLNGSFVREGAMLPHLTRVLQLPKLRLNLNGSFVRDGAML